MANFRLCDDRCGRDFDCSFTAMDYVDGQVRDARPALCRQIPPHDSRAMTIPAAGLSFKLIAAGNNLGTTLTERPSPRR